MCAGYIQNLATCDDFRLQKLPALTDKPATLADARECGQRAGNAPSGQRLLLYGRQQS